MNRFLKFWGVIFLVHMLFLSGCRNSDASWEQLYREDGEDTIPIESIEPTPTADQTERVICVYICGAVMNPGVYELPEGSRVIQVIEAAGGLTEDADALLENQARFVEDGEQIRIYTKEEAKVFEMQKREGTASDGKVNINTATVEMLMTLSGIGEAKAEAIIAYREANGGFDVIEDIMQIPGIKEAVFSKIRDKITV